ncbi:cyclin-I2 [Heterocephalus glaber]|uniref:Cyclin-I2 n=1 Tax=Heterocephalus glaber TaxID=10181 RepID=A0AAX6RL08_HETGA|nr:cyclin-I2 [Heterocephalus glaber]
MASGAQPPAGSEPRAEGAGGARSAGGLSDAEPQRPPPPPPPARSAEPRWPRARSSSAPAASEARAPPPPRTPCDLRGPLDERRVLEHLHVALRREARVWRGGSLQPEIRGAFLEVVVWLLERENAFHFARTTFNLALSIFGRLLVSVKVSECHLQCAIITCLRLAAKLNEEEETLEDKWRSRTEARSCRFFWPRWLMLARWMQPALNTVNSTCKRLHKALWPQL